MRAAGAHFVAEDLAVCDTLLSVIVSYDQPFRLQQSN